MPDDLKHTGPNEQESVTDRPAIGVSESLRPGPDGRIHPVKTWEELREMVCGDGVKRKLWVTICQF